VLGFNDVLMEYICEPASGTTVITMHNITKIKLFRILLRITYFPSLFFLYPLARLRRKSASGIFFFFDRFSLGGAQRIHLDILKTIPELDKQIFFTRYSPNAIFKEEFYSIPDTDNSDIHVWCDFLLLRLFSVHYFSFYINRHKQAQVFGANSTFFYDMLPFINDRITKTELLHNFTFGKKGMEFFGLLNVEFLTNRIVYDSFTLSNIKKQYEEYKIDPVFLQKIWFIEPGVDIPREVIKKFDFPLKIICAGRGGPQKRIWLVNRIAEYCLDKEWPVRFYFAGTLISELSEKTRSASVLYGEVSNADAMGQILSNAEIALLTSSYEGFPMFIKEAMAHGCIPVVTALPGNLTHLRDGENCLLINEIQDEDQIVSEALGQISLLIHDKALCRKLSKNAHQYAEIYFNRTAFTTAYRELLIPQGNK
jgi:glycosyltransferase involved in cell wall biosynthesis